MNRTRITIGNRVKLIVMVNPVMANARFSSSQGALIGANTAFNPAWGVGVENRLAAPLP